MDSITNLRLNVLVFILVYLFVSGADINLILPTAWYYIRSLGRSVSFYGAVLAVPTLGMMLSSPVVGKLADKTRRVKLILAICCSTKVISYLVYAIPLSGYYPLAGCFFSGAANSAFGVLYGEMVRYTSNENLSKLFILVDSIYVAGAACGPVFGSFGTFNANVFGWKIDQGNSPGLILATIWLVMLCVLTFLPSDFGANEICLNDGEEVKLLEEKPCTALIENLSSPICCLLYLTFTTFALHSVCTTLTSLFAMELFHWKLFHVKLLFGTGMMSVFVMYLVSYIATTYHSERSLVALTVVLQLPALLISIFYAFLWKNVSFVMSYFLILYVYFGFSQASFTFVSVLLSKIMPTRHASIVQSFLLLFGNIGYIIGRAVAGMMFSQARLVGFSIGLTGMWVVGITWFLIIFSRFAPERLMD